MKKKTDLEFGLRGGNQFWLIVRISTAYHFLKIHYIKFPTNKYIPMNRIIPLVGMDSENKKEIQCKYESSYSNHFSDTKQGTQSMTMKGFGFEIQECKICKYKSTTLVHLMRHTVKIFITTKQVSCNFCVNKFIPNYLLKSHMMNQANLNYRCDKVWDMDLQVLVKISPLICKETFYVIWTNPSIFRDVHSQGDRYFLSRL